MNSLDSDEMWFCNLIPCVILLENMPPGSADSLRHFLNPKQDYQRNKETNGVVCGKTGVQVESISWTLVAEDVAFIYPLLALIHLCVIPNKP